MDFDEDLKVSGACSTSPESTYRLKSILGVYPKYIKLTPQHRILTTNLLSSSTEHQQYSLNDSTNKPVNVLLTDLNRRQIKIQRGSASTSVAAATVPKHVNILPKPDQKVSKVSVPIILNRNVSKMSYKVNRKKLPGQKSVIRLVKSGNTYHSLEILDRKNKTKIAESLLKLTGSTSNQNDDVAPQSRQLLKLSGVSIDYPESSYSLNCEQKLQQPSETLSGVVKVEQKEKLSETSNSLANIKYRVIYPADLELTSTNEIVIKNPCIENSIDNLLSTNLPDDIEKNETTQKKSTKSNKKKAKVKHSKLVYKDEEEEISNLRTVSTTKSGRTVKLPKLPYDATQNQKQKYKYQSSVMTCLRCERRFQGVRRLNRHYSQFPTHKPNSTHTDLFMCFVDIMSDCPPQKKGFTFVEQLENLIVKLINMVPCMINNVISDDGNVSRINDDLARMLKIEPGTYNVSFDEAVECYEKGRNRCKHILRVNNVTINEENRDSEIWNPKSHEEIVEALSDVSMCVRCQPVDKWPLLKMREMAPHTKTVIENNIVCSNVDIISTNIEETLQNEANNIKIAKVWMQNGNMETVDENIFSVPNVPVLPVLSLESDMSNEPVKLNMLSVQTPIKTKENITNFKSTSAEEKLPHFSQYQRSHFNIKSTPIKSNITSFNKVQIKDSTPVFVQLSKDDASNNNQSAVTDNLDKSSDMQIDINAILSELSNNNPTNEQTMSTDENEFFEQIDKQEQIHKDYSLQSSICDMPGRDVQRCSEMARNNFLVCNETAVRSPSDRVLPSDHMNRNEHLVSNLAQNGNRNNHQKNDFVGSSKNDCLLSGRNNEMSKNDRLLSSGNIQLSQSDQLISANIQANQNDSLDNLCENESNLEASRMSLPLLDQLGSDCLSFADSELRGSSLDIPLDLFPFHHTE